MQNSSGGDGEGEGHTRTSWDKHAVTRHNMEPFFSAKKNTLKTLGPRGTTVLYKYNYSVL
jgi:hypothetical protein